MHVQYNIKIYQATVFASNYFYVNKRPISSSLKVVNLYQLVLLELANSNRQTSTLTNLFTLLAHGYRVITLEQVSSQSTRLATSLTKLFDDLTRVRRTCIEIEIA